MNLEQLWNEHPLFLIFVPLSLLCLIIALIMLIFTEIKIKEYIDNCRKNEYWLYYKSSYKTYARYTAIAFLICISELLFYMIVNIINTHFEQSLALYGTFLTLAVPFLLTYLLVHNHILDSTDHDIDRTLGIFIKGVRLLDVGQRILEKSAAENNPDNLRGHQDNNLLKFINKELMNIQTNIKTDTLPYRIETQFILDCLKLNIMKYFNYYNEIYSIRKGEAAARFQSSFQNLLKLYKYFLDDMRTEEYKNHWFYTLKDIDLIRKKCGPLDRKTCLEILQVKRVLK